MISIIYILLLLSLYFGICIFAGITWALGVFSIFLAALATVFIIKKDSYFKYIQLVNPKYALLYSGKSDDFKRKHRTTDLTGFYIIAAFMLFLSTSLPNYTLSIQGSLLIYLIPATILITIALWCMSLLILKKSSNNSKFWFYFIASISAAILALALVMNFIL